MTTVVGTLAGAAVSRAGGTGPSGVHVVAVFAGLALLAVEAYCTVGDAGVAEIVAQVITNIAQSTDVGADEITTDAIS